MILPWQAAQCHQLWQAKLENRLPHALLLIGTEGIGIDQFALSFSQALLCEKTSQLTIDSFPTKENILQQPCDICHACRLIANHTHPNVLWIAPEKEGQAIKVDQIRELSEFTQRSSWQAGYRVSVIYPANAMNINAANALLKTLEEPSVGALILLISDHSSTLPATIVSRCQRTLFSPPNEEEAFSWLEKQLPETSNISQASLLLKLTHNKPLTVLTYLENGFLSQREKLFQGLYLLNQNRGDPIQLAADLQEINIVLLIDVIQTWMTDLVWLQLRVDADIIINQDFLNQLLELVNRTHIKTNMQFINYLQQIRGQIGKGINLNKLLLTENILIKWMALAA